MKHTLYTATDPISIKNEYLIPQKLPCHFDYFNYFLDLGLVFFFFFFWYSNPTRMVLKTEEGEVEGYSITENLIFFSIA